MPRAAPMTDNNPVTPDPGPDVTTEAQSTQDDTTDFLSRNPGRIRRMFEDIAPKYDFLNHFLSVNRDKAWRRHTMKIAGPRPGDRILDVCTGTGDLAFEASRHPDVEVLGTDFCTGMVRIARQKRDGTPGHASRARALHFSVADTLRLPFKDSSFDIVTVGFGIRNVANLAEGLREMRRVLKPGGRAFILEFTTGAIPGLAFLRSLFNLYFHHVLPRVGRWLSSAKNSGEDDAYRYLPESVAKFPPPDKLATLLSETGFDDVKFRRFTLGIVALHWGQRVENTAAEDTDTAEDRALVLVPGSPRPFAEIARRLTLYCDEHPSDLATRVRYGAGILVRQGNKENLAAIATQLESDLGVHARVIPARTLADMPRGYRARSIQLRASGDVVVSLVGGREIEIASENLRGIGIHALPEVTEKTDDDEPSGAATGASGPSESLERLAHVTLEVAASSKDRLRSRTILDWIGESEFESLQFFLTLYVQDPIGPVRLERTDIDFTVLGEDIQPHSLDNFLLVAERILERFPELLNADATRTFIETLDPKPLVFLKPEEAQRHDQWMQAWIRLEDSDRMRGES
jgi:demethylmenaquinone methyltransferase/2-methoxy-6-polyprenyl-1,4-benzoquinol methylase